MNILEVKTSYEYITQLHERLEDSLMLARKEIQKSQKRYKKHYVKKAKPRRLEVGDQVLILLLTDSNKLLMQWRGPYIVETCVGANEYRIKMGSKTETYHVNVLKKYIVRELEVDVVHTSNKDDATIAVAGVIYQDTDPEVGVVRPSMSSYASPIVMDKKKDGSNKVCVDFRKLNKSYKITEVDPEPTTKTEDLFCRLSGLKYLSKIDLTKGYWQIPVAPEDVYKTAFVTPDGQYEFLRMPFGMVNSGATLVQGLEKVLE